MKEVTAWKVYETTDKDGKQEKVLVGYNPQLQKGFVEVVTESKEKEVNGYKLVGAHNYYFEEYQTVWSSWVNANFINSITDISDQYE
jgi:hypothetical protein